jgi:pimeloyl-ACP methyl ester carboxylesterase/molybdopterin/thiamine biosynthesis adenylyltransferase
MSDSFYRESFARNIGIVTETEQERLSAATVAVAGAGGIGGNTLVTLARMGVGGFRIADFDRFEPANINRQYGAHAETIGKLKCEVLAEELRRINPSVRCEIFSQGFTDETAGPLLAGADLAIDAIDFYAIDDHLKFHSATRAHGLFTLMGSPVGFSACMQIFDPRGMSLEEYCGIQPQMPAIEKQLRYACGLVPSLAHIDYFDVSAGASRTDFISRTGPSMASACALASALVANETVMLLLGRRPSRPIPHTVQFDPYTYRYENVCIPGGMRDYDPAPAIARIPDKSSLVAQVLQLFYSKPKEPRFAVNGVNLYHKVEGEGPALLLISPLGADAGFWTRNVQELRKHFRVITFDNRGSGESRGPVDGLTTEVLARDAITLLDQLGVRQVHIAGVALGGLVAQQIARLEPALVQSLVLASSYAAADSHIAAATAGWRRIASTSGMEPLFDECVHWLFSDDLTENRSDVNQLKTFYRLTLQEPRSFIAQSVAGVEHDSRGWLRELRVPCLILHGGADKLVGLHHATELAQQLPDAHAVVIDEGAHFFNWECAHRFNDSLLEFHSSTIGAR